MAAEAISSRPLRVAVLASTFSGYYDAQLTALRERTGAEVEVVYRRPLPSAPYDDQEFRALKGALSWEEKVPADRVAVLLDRLQPDVMLVTSWNHGVYVRAARRWRHRALRLMVMDNPWRSTAKQWSGVVISRPYLKPAFDAVFLPNERQRVFAKKLGFSDDQVWDGVYCCDQPRFEVDRDNWPDEPKSFLYVGKLAAAKGVDVLLRAYAAYRDRVEEPWPLYMAGTGPLEEVAKSARGVVTLGFRQPAAMPEVFAAASCFVLPSIFEPWGVVIHEAAASGLPIICTVACGASVDMVRDGYNGFTVAAGNAQALTDAMVVVGTMPADRRREMGRASVGLSRQLTPQRWADTFDQRARAWLNRYRLAGQPVGRGE